MLYVGFTFALVLAIVMGAYWVFILRQERAEESALRRRLGRAPATQRVAEGLERRAQRLSHVPLLEHLLHSQLSLVGPLEQLVAQSGLKLTVGFLLLSSACLFLGGVLIGQLWLRSILVGLFLGVLLGALPTVYVRVMRARRVRRFEELFPEALDLMTRAMRSGHTFINAIGMVAEELPEPIAAEFKMLHDQQNFGMPVNDALREFGQRVPLLAAKFFVTAIVTQRESGGNLTEVLDNLAKVIRDRFMVMRQVRTKSAHGRITGWILVALPPTVAMILFVVSPGYYDMMLAERVGIQMIAAAIVLQVTGALIIRKIINIEY